MPVILSEADVRAVLSTDDLIAAMERALVEYSSGRVQQPLRTVLEVGETRAFFGLMPAFLPDPAALGTKLVTVFASNREKDLPSHLATIVLLDPATGALLALLDGRYITEARTAAVSAVSTRLLAREEADVLALIGSGVQARSHLEAIGRVRRLREVRVWSPSTAHMGAFVHDMQPHTPARIVACASAEGAVRDAGIVALVTSSREPVVRSAWIADGAHICAVGACRPDQREMEGELVGRGRVFVDSRGGALAEAGDILLAIRDGLFAADRIAGELGELAAGRITGREHDTQVTLFKSLGMAVEDVAAARLAFERATERGLGRGVVL
jgi:ornithine cyclodeaminase/alanine dehydrogenase-like protein (mu-crystallin family)